MCSALFLLHYVTRCIHVSLHVALHVLNVSKKKQHEKKMQRDIHVNERGSEAAGEEQHDKLRKTVRFEQVAPSAAASLDPTVALEYPASGETQSRPGSVLVQTSGHVDGRKSRYIGEVLEWYRGEDAGDLN